MKVLVTDAAGFVGSHLSKRLLEESCQILGIDSLNNYCDVNLKKEEGSPNFVNWYREYYATRKRPECLMQP